ncbi:MAG: FAD binding domain-containing protein [Treponema sp.]|nr:FAD binding domain-containing protein [Treponema sp.]
MKAAAESVLRPENHAELFALWQKYRDAVPVAGGTAFIREQERRSAELPPVLLSLAGIRELRRINRSERFLEFGSLVNLGRIVELRKYIPDVLLQCLRGIASPQIRNLATIGGNVCCGMDTVSVLTALDAQYELRGAQSARWISASRFSGEQAAGGREKPELLYRVRVPMESWEYSAYLKFGCGPGAGRNAVFLAGFQKGMLADLRVVYKVEGGVLRDKDGETLLVGKRLPLNRRSAESFVSHQDNFLRGADGVTDLYRKEFLNFVRANVGNFSE